MDKRILKGCKSEDQKIKAKNEFYSAQGLRAKLIDLLEDELVTVRREMRDESAFAQSSWSEFVASKLGEERGILKAIKLLSDRTEEK